MLEVMKTNAQLLRGQKEAVWISGRRKDVDKKGLYGGSGQCSVGWQQVLGLQLSVLMQFGK
jgi:hypothetical protein